ncbi:MAG TPA: DUF423 domain-containing protein [Aquaticitalea sp.]|nr:DUF423 domain-containing protein [Aquaticitalea sp.]
MNKTILLTASILGMTAVMLGAFAAHGLKQLVSAEMVQTFETGVRYQMYHAFLLLIVGNLIHLSVRTKRIVLYLTVLGVLLFSGSIYGLATNELTRFDFKAIGFVTPIGGALLIAAWAVLLVGFLKLKNDNYKN